MKCNSVIGILTIALTSIVLSSCSENDTSRGELFIEPGFVRTPSVGAPATAGYLTISSPVDDVLLSASMDEAATVEIHTMKMSDGIMKMRKLDKLKLPAGEEVHLTQGGDHLMIMELGDELATATSVDITLTFETAGIKVVTLPVQRTAAPHSDR